MTYEYVPGKRLLVESVALSRERATVYVTTCLCDQSPRGRPRTVRLRDDVSKIVILVMAEDGSLHTRAAKIETPGARTAFESTCGPAFELPVVTRWLIMHGFLPPGTPEAGASG